MNFGVAIHSDEAPDHRRLLLSLAGALLIASLAFALVFLLFGSMPYVTLHWLSTLPRAKDSGILSLMDTLAWSFALFPGVFTSILLAIIARKHRSKQRHPIKLA